MELATLKLTVDARQAVAEAEKLQVTLQKVRVEADKTSKSTDGLGKSHEKSLPPIKRTEAELRKLQLAEIAAYREADRLAASTKRVGDSSAQAAKDVQSMGGSMKAVWGAFAAYGGVRAVAQLGEMADAYKLTTARLSLVTASSAELATVQRTLFDSAQRTGTAFGDVATLYTRVARNAQTLGKSQADLLKFTELVNMSIISSGATSSEASAGVLQLSQALSKGRLDGDEFRSVMENMPQVADALTASLNITKGELYALAREGKITGTTVVNAMLSMEQQTRQAFESMPLTISRAIQMAKNDILRFIGEVDSATGASGFFADMIRNAPGAVGRVLGGTTVGTLARSVGGLFPRAAGATSNGQSAMVGTGTLSGMPFLGRGTREQDEERKAWAEAQAKAARRAAWEEEAITRALRLANARFQAENPTGPARPGASATSLGFDNSIRGIIEGRGVTQLPEGMRTTEFADSMANRMKATVQEMTAGARELAEASKMITENFLRGVQTSFASFFAGIFTEGVASFRGLMDSFKNLVIQAFAELAAKRLMSSLFGGGGIGGLLGGLSGGAMLGLGVGAFALSKLLGGNGARSGYRKPAGVPASRPVVANDIMPRGNEIRSSVGSALQEGTAVRLFGVFESMRQSLQNIEGLLRNGALMGGTSSSGLDKALGARSQSLRLAAGVAVVG